MFNAVPILKELILTLRTKIWYWRTKRGIKSNLKKIIKSKKNDYSAGIISSGVPKRINESKIKNRRNNG